MDGRQEWRAEDPGDADARRSGAIRYAERADPRKVGSGLYRARFLRICRTGCHADRPCGEAARRVEVGCARPRSAAADEDERFDAEVDRSQDLRSDFAKDYRRWRQAVQLPKKMNAKSARVAHASRDYVNQARPGSMTVLLGEANIERIVDPGERAPQRPRPREL
jgi:hypothetical protein